jgi:TPP-dependent pyruvate/acetoin dehydrogenase alpha subunit
MKAGAGMSISNIGGGAALPNIFSGNAAGSAEKLKKSPVDEFLEIARQSPAERIRAAILEEMGITEDELENMGAAEREAMEKAIAERIKEKVLDTAEQKTGMLVDKTA